MQHNSSALTRVKGADQNNPHWAVFQYEASLEQLRAIIASARHCQQMLEFHCRRSRLRDPQGRCPQCAQVSSLCQPLPAPAGPCQPLTAPPPLLRHRWKQHGVQVWLDPGEDASLSPSYPDCFSMLRWAVPSFLLITSLRRCFLCLPGPHCSSPALALIFQTIYCFTLYEGICLPGHGFHHACSYLGYSQALCTPPSGSQDQTPHWLLSSQFPSLDAGSGDHTAFMTQAHI